MCVFNWVIFSCCSISWLFDDETSDKNLEGRGKLLPPPHSHFSDEETEAQLNDSAAQVVSSELWKPQSDPGGLLHGPRPDHDTPASCGWREGGKVAWAEGRAWVEARSGEQAASLKNKPQLCLLLVGEGKEGARRG